MDMTVIGKNIADLRRQRSVKQDELARFVGVSAQAVSKWENGGVPDTELLPKIADFFEVSIDALFGRSIADYCDLRTALIKEVSSKPPEQRMKTVLNCCWSMEQALFNINIPKKHDGVEGYEKALGENEQRFSSVMDNSGFTRMGIANVSQYFLVVPDAKSTDAAYFDGVDYEDFFKTLSDKAVFDTIVMLNKREFSKAFTPNLIVKKMGVTVEKAEDIINMLAKYHLLSQTQIEMDDETQTVYKFCPTPAFVALLIFAHEMIKPPQNWTFYSEGRGRPYLK